MFSNAKYMFYETYMPKKSEYLFFVLRISDEISTFAKCNEGI